MKNENAQTKFEMVKEFYDLINNSYQLNVKDTTSIHNVFNSTFYEKTRCYRDTEGRIVEIFIELDNGYKYTSPQNQMKGIYNERYSKCKSDECPLFDFINIYADELGDNVNNAIKNVKFKMEVCGDNEERYLMDCAKSGKAMYESLLDYMQHFHSLILEDRHNYIPDYIPDFY